MPPDERTEQRTEKPTQRRRRRARSQGQVAQSAEVNNVLVLAAGLGALGLFGSYSFPRVAAYMVGCLGNLHSATVTADGAPELARNALAAFLSSVLPTLLFVGCVALLASVAQTGPVFAPRKLVPDLNHIHPVRGFKNLVSLSAMVRLLVAVAKLAIIALVAYVVVRARVYRLAALLGESTWGIFQASKRFCLALLWQVTGAMAVVAVADYAYQRWRHEKQLMMTKTELKEERKREEGHAVIRSRQAGRRREFMRARMVQAVPQADVVVTNPTEVAVALQWDEQTMSAPKVVAKGRGYLAIRIKQIARENGVQIMERKELARALYAAVEVGMEIPPKLYHAVAEVLAFIMGRKRSRNGG